MNLLIPLIRALIAFNEVRSLTLAKWLVSTLMKKEERARLADQFTAKLFGDPADILEDDDENSLLDTPNEEDDLDDEDGAKSFDMPLDEEGDGETADFDESSEDEARADSTEETTSDEEEESDEDEENEELLEDEEDNQDVEDEQGEGSSIDADTESDDLDPDDDQDYNEEEQQIINDLQEEDSGAYDYFPEGEENVETMFDGLLADSDMPTGEESEELDEDNLESGPELLNEDTDLQEDFLDIRTDDAESFLLDAAMLVNDTEIFDTGFGTIPMIDMGEAIFDDLP